MAVLHRKEEKIQAVLGRLPKKYNSDDFVAMFIKLYSKDWGKIKSAYIKASQDKEPGTLIHMPKPDLYLKQILEIFLSQNIEVNTEIPKEEIVIPETVAIEEKLVVKATKAKTTAKKINETEPAVAVKKSKVIATEKPIEKAAKSKVVVKKIEETVKPVVTKKPKAAPKKKAD